MSRIILNADDFGKSAERNRAVDDAFKQGLISSAGLIVTGKHLQEAVDLMMEGGYVDRVHLHVNLSTNLPDEGSDDIPITDAIKQEALFCKDGKFVLYKGLPRNIMTLFKWRVIYHEIVAQYERFIEITGGKGDISHIGFHLWYNLTWPVSVALRSFARKYRIKSIRYVSFHQRKKWRNRLYRLISWVPTVNSIPATNIDYFVSKRELFRRFEVIELYCHPNYKNGVLLDDSPSYLKHARQSLAGSIQMIQSTQDIVFVSWRDIF